MQVVQRLEAESDAASREQHAKHDAAVKQLKRDHAAALDQVSLLHRSAFSSAIVMNLPSPANATRSRPSVLNSCKYLHAAQARSSQQRYADRHRETAAAVVAAQERADSAAAQVLELRKDAATKNDTIAWLEKQVQAAQEVRFSCADSPFA
jgi:hypothetical protein